MGNFSDSEKDDLAVKISAVLKRTELGGNTSVIYKFAYAALGTSAYSFGIQQFDVGARDDARKFLKDNGFTDDEISKLSKHESISAADLAPLNKKLSDISAKVDTFSNDDFRGAVTKLDNMISYVEKKNAKIAKAIKDNKRVQLALIDYDNQFNIGGLSSPDPPNNSMLTYLCGNEVSLSGGKLKLGDDITVSSIQDFIDATTYGSQDANKTAVASRQANLAKALDEVAPEKPAAPPAPVKTPVPAK